MTWKLNPIIKHPARINTRNFTLLEVLVVSFIIAILIGGSLASLMSAKDQARFGRWFAYSANIKAEPALVAYYNFQDADPLKLKNQAFCTSIPTYDQRKVDATINSAKWAKGRWKNKGALWMNGVNSYAMIGANNMIHSLPKEFAFEIWFYPITLNQGYLFESTATIYNPNALPGAPPGIAKKFAPVVTDMFSLEINGNNLTLRYAANISYKPNPNNRQGGGDGYAWGTLVTTTDITTQSYTLTGNFKPQNWYHVIVSYSYADQYVKLYLNGKLVQKYTEVRPLVYLFEQSYIGGLATAGNSFNGIIDELGIYNRALTDYDVKAHYAMGAPRGN